MKIALIWAEDQAGWIGKDGQLPWHLPVDLKHFKNLTSGHPIVMGRRTMESLQGPLPKRDNLVVTHQPVVPAGFIRLSSPTAIVPWLEAHEQDLAFVIGGAELFKVTLPLATDLFRTVVAGDFSGDTKIPPLAYRQWRQVEQRQVAQPTASIAWCRFEHWVRLEKAED